MGFLQVLFNAKVTNPALLAAMEKYHQQNTDDNLVAVWQKFLSSKVLLATSRDSARAVGKLKSMREATGHSFYTVTNEHNDNFLAIFIDSESFKLVVPEDQATLTLKGSQAYELAMAKGFMGMILNPRTEAGTELKVWQHQVLVERVGDAMKLHSLATKMARAGYPADSEAVLKAAIFASQRDPGPHHPFTAELNIELARSLRHQNKLEQSEWAYKQALTIYETSGNTDLDVASTAEALAGLLCEMHRAPLAVPYMERALGIYERTPGGKPDSIARILCMLGDIKCEAGKQEEGEQYYRRAAVTLEERKHPDVLGVLLRLGELCEKADRHKEALAHYLRVLTLLDTLKRTKTIDGAKAAHRAASLQLQENKPGEALPLLERALQLYGKDENPELIDAVQRMIAVAKEKVHVDVLEEQQSTSDPAKSSFGRNNHNSKRPAELPFLDMSAMRSNPKAKLVDAHDKKAESAAAPQGDSEAQALDQMRAFLDSVNKDGSQTQAMTRPGSERPPVAASSKFVRPIDIASTFKHQEAESPAEEKLVAKENAVAEDKPLVKEKPPAPAETEAESRAAVPAEDEDAVAALFRAALDPKPSASSMEAPPAPRADVPPVPPLAPKANSPVPPLQSADGPVPPKQAQEPAAATAKESFEGDQPSHVISDKQEIGKSMAEDISGIFNKSVMGEANKNARFDQPIGERTPLQATPAPEPVVEAAPAKPNLDTSRFDTPIQERLQEDATSESDNAEVTAEESLLSDIDDSVNDAFKALLGETAGTADRFDIPIQERMAASAEPVRQVEPVLPAEPVPQAEPVLQAEAVPQAAGPVLQATEPVLQAEPVATAVATVADTPKTALLDTTALPRPKLDISSVTSPEELLILIESRLQEEPQNLDLWLRKGTTLAQMQRLDEAIKVFDKATTISPNDLKAWYCKGSTLHLKGNFEDAIYCFNYVLKLDGENIKALMRKAECLVKLGRIDQGMTLYDRVVTLQPQFVGGWLSKARAHVQQRRLEEAMTCYQTALTIEPKNEEALKALNLIATKLGATTQS